METDNLVNYFLSAIREIDEIAVQRRVAKVKTDYPQAPPDILAQVLIKQKSLQAGTVGAITSGVSLIPGIGPLVTFTFGVGVDTSLTSKMQIELVLEIAELYGYKMSNEEKQKAILTITGMGTASDQLLDKGGAVIARKASEQLAEKAAEKAIPLLGVTVSAGKNILTTYLVGQRAKIYFSQEPDAVGSWTENIQAIRTIDGRQIISWLVETTERSWQIVGYNFWRTTIATVVAGQGNGELLVRGVTDRNNSPIMKQGRDIASQIGQATESVLDSGIRLGHEVTIGAKIAGWVATESGRGIVEGAKEIISTFTPGGQTENSITSILTISNRTERIQKVIANRQRRNEQLAAFGAYLSGAMQFPFSAAWKDPDETGHVENITILGVNSLDKRRGILLQVQRGQKQRRLLAEQVWSKPNSKNGLILDDYRQWIDSSQIRR